MHIALVHNSRPIAVNCRGLTQIKHSSARSLSDDSRETNALEGRRSGSLAASALSLSTGSLSVGSVAGDGLAALAASAAALPPRCRCGLLRRWFCGAARSILDLDAIWVAPNLTTVFCRHR